MQAGTHTGRCRPARNEEPHTEKTSGRCFYCGQPAHGVDARQRVNVCSGCALKPIAVTDGGQIELEDPYHGDVSLEHDPRAFEYSFSPALVEAQRDDGTELTTFASVQIRDSGVLVATQWTGHKLVLPAWRWAEVRYLRTRRVHPDETSKVRQQVAAGDWHLLPDELRERLDRPAPEDE
ncbi:MAG: hypothetical protein ACI8XM_000221 [Haloarculaceae archaeon]|jgi:hypothetical protein